MKTRRVLGIGLAWSIFWLAFGMTVAGVVGIVSLSWLTIARRVTLRRDGAEAAV